MSGRNDAVRRELGMGMPTPARDMASERYSITRTSNEPEPEKELRYQFVGGVIMVNDGDGWRLATEEEIQELTGGLMCLKRNLFSEIAEGIDALRKMREGSSPDVELFDHVTLLGKS